METLKDPFILGAHVHVYAACLCLSSVLYLHFMPCTFYYHLQLLTKN